MPSDLMTFRVRISNGLERDKFGNEGRVGRLGIGAGKVSIAPVGAGESVTLAWSQTIGIMRTMVAGLAQIITGERSVKELGGPIKIANWDYRFEQRGGKTLVVETWTDHRPPVFGTIVGLFIGVTDRPDRNRQGMEATLARLATAVES